MNKADYCFVCGKENPIGLKVDIQVEEGKAWFYFYPKKEYEGWEGIVHGGIISSLLDEAMVWACKYYGVDVVTGELKVRYVSPFYLKYEKVFVEGRIIKHKGPLFLGEGEVLTEDRIVIARAWSKMVKK